MSRPAKFFPTLRYQDPAAAVEWLCRVFGFQRHFVAEHEGRVVHAQLRLGDGLLFLGPDDPDDRYGLHSPRALNGTNQCVCIGFDDDIDAHYRASCLGGADIITQPHDTPYGARDYTCRDPEGHVWCFGNYFGEPG